MNSNSKRFTSLLLALFMLFGVFMPLVKAAEDKATEEEYTFDESGQGQIHIINRVKGGTKNLIGAQYKIVRTHKMLKTGKLEPITPEEVIKDSKHGNNEFFEITDENGITIDVPKTGRYEIEQIKRPAGFYYGQGTQENGKHFEGKAIIDFPLMKGGKPISFQTQEVEPKMEEVRLDLTLTKTLGLNGTNLPGVSFTAYPIKLHGDDKNLTVAEKDGYNVTFKSNDDGTYKCDKKKGLTEGTYYLVEEVSGKVLTDNKLAPKTIFNLEVKARGEKEEEKNKASSPADFEILLDGKPLEGSIINYQVPTPGSPDNNNPKNEKTASPFMKVVRSAEYDATKNPTTNAGNVATIRKGKNAVYTISLRLPQDIRNYHSYSFVDKIDGKAKLVEAKAIGESKGLTINANKETNEVTGSIDTKTAVGGALIEIEVTVTGETVTKKDNPVKNNVSVAYNPLGKTGGVDPSKGEDKEKETDKKKHNETVDIPENDQPKLNIAPFKLTIKAQDGSKKDVKLEGATFNIIPLDKDGKEVTSEIKPFTTGGDGSVQIPDLAGKYKIKNIKAPDGYPINATEQTVDFTKSNNDKEIIFDFFKSETKLPSTGTLGTIPYLMGTAMVGIPAFFLIGKKKKEENEEEK